MSSAALEAGHAELFVAERAAAVPSVGILLAIRRRSFARAASIYNSQARLLLRGNTAIANNGGSQ
jgi:hypothetical protein